MTGDPEILIRIFSENFSLRSAMAAAGYVGRGAYLRAAADIEAHGEELRRMVACRVVGDSGGDGNRTDFIRRTMEECCEIAFAPVGSEVKTPDKLRALDMYLRLGEMVGEPNEQRGITVICDYGGGADG